MSVPVDDYELKFRRVTVSIGEGRTGIIYIEE